MICQKCGMQLNPNATSCNYCGTVVKSYQQIKNDYYNSQNNLSINDPRKTELYQNNYKPLYNNQHNQNGQQNPNQQYYQNSQYYPNNYNFDTHTQKSNNNVIIAVVLIVAFLLVICVVLLSLIGNEDKKTVLNYDTKISVNCHSILQFYDGASSDDYDLIVESVNINTNELIYEKKYSIDYEEAQEINLDEGRYMFTIGVNDDHIRYLVDAASDNYENIIKVDASDINKKPKLKHADSLGDYIKIQMDINAVIPTITKETSKTVNTQRTNTTQKSTTRTKTTKALTTKSSTTKKVEVSGWKKAYIDYINSMGEADSYAYCLIYVNDDNIPELYARPDYRALPSIVCTYGNSRISDVKTGLSDLIFKPLDNILELAGGNSGIMRGNYYQIKNGKFVELHRYECIETYDSNIGEYVEKYTWDNVNITKGDMEERRTEQIDRAKFDDSSYGEWYRYSSIIKAIKDY